MKEWFSVTELVKLGLPGLPKTQRGIDKFIETKGWKQATDRIGKPLARRRKGAGGGWKYNFALLPNETQIALAAAKLKIEARDYIIETATMAVSNSSTATMQDPTLRDVEIVRRDARLVVVKAADTHARKADLKKYVSDRLFAKIYNAGQVDVEPWVRSAVAKVSERSLQRWRAALNGEGANALAGGHRQRKSVLASAEDGKVALKIAALIVKNPHLTSDHIRDLIADEFGNELNVDGRTVDLPTRRSFRNHISQWKQENRADLLKLTDPDRFKSSTRLSGRNMNAHVVGLNQLWEIDASPADVLCTDGRYNLYAVVDIWSRRVMALVTKTPRTEASLQLVRRAVLEWGVPDELRTDNGSDFVSHQFKRALHSLSIEQDITAPFSPEQKGTVERAIGTIQRGLMPLLPGFVGHSVSDRKQIEARKTFASRLGEKADKAFCVELTADELQAAMDAWLADKYSHAPHSGLDGKTPFEMAASWKAPIRTITNPRALDLLLARAPGEDGMRTATKYGIKLDGTYFIAGEIMPGTRVFVRHDPEDMGRIFCFESETGKFIAEAIAPERLGVDPAAATAEAKNRQAKMIKERTDAVRREARKIKARDMIDGVLRKAAADTGNLVAFPQRGEQHSTLSLEQAAAARSEAKKPQLTDEERAAHERTVAEFEADAGDTAEVVELPETPKQRFARALAVELAIEEGKHVDQDEVLWLGGYRQSAEYKAHASMFEDFGLAWLEGPN